MGLWTRSCGFVRLKCEYSFERSSWLLLILGVFLSACVVSLDKGSFDPGSELMASSLLGGYRVNFRRPICPVSPSFL